MNDSYMYMGYRDLISALAGDGWEVGYTVVHSQMQVARLISPTRLLYMTIGQHPVDGSAHCGVGILPGGSGEPAHWRASDDAPPPSLWCEAARAASRAHEEARKPPFQPCAVIARLGWLHTKYRHDGQTIEGYICLATNRQLTYRHAARASPASWTITRPETSIHIAVIIPEPYALPALVLALILDASERAALFM